MDIVLYDIVNKDSASNIIYKGKVCGVFEIWIENSFFFSKNEWIVLSILKYELVFCWDYIKRNYSCDENSYAHIFMASVHEKVETIECTFYIYKFYDFLEMKNKNKAKTLNHAIFYSLRENVKII